jgi:hypothetical protein
MGSVPITLKSTLDPLYSQFPTILLDKWSDLFAPGALQKFRDQIRAKYGDEPFRADGEVAKKLTTQYWVDKIKTAQKKMRQVVHS